MNCRRYGSKATLGFWALVLVAVVASTNTLPVVLLLLAFAALIAGGIAIARRMEKPELRMIGYSRPRVDRRCD